MMKRRSEAGQTLTLVAFGMVTFLAAAGLAVDMGIMRYEKRMMQSAADSAALAAATDQNLGELGSANADAQAVATANGFQDGVNNTTVTVTNPDSAVNPGAAVEVQIQRILPSFFMTVVGINSSTITASGVATIGTSGGCIYALQTGGLGLTANAGINSPNCGIVDNGPLNGAGIITAASIGVYGPNGSGTPVETIAQPAADPLLYVNQNPPTPSSPCIPDPMVIATSGPLMNGVITLTPGTYCGITINPGGIVTFSSGLYILNGTGLLITGTGTANGAGVTFYNAPGTGAFTFNGTGAVTLSAPTSGVGTLPAGILFYQDPGDPTPADLSEGGSGNVTLSGTLYFPDAPLTVAGSLNPSANALVVAQSITFSGSILWNADSTPNPPAPIVPIPGGSPLENVSLVE